MTPEHDTSQFDDEDFIDSVRSHHPVAFTSDVAQDVGCTHRTASYRLNALADDGHICMKKKGTLTVWWIED